LSLKAKEESADPPHVVTVPEFISILAIVAIIFGLLLSAIGVLVMSIVRDIRGDIAELRNEVERVRRTQQLL
jgi:hypothetical protein